MRVWVWGVVLAGGLALADWGAGQGLAAWLRAAVAGSKTVAAQVSAEGFPARVGVRLDAPRLTEAGRTVLALERATITAPVWNPLSWRLDLPLPQRIILQGLPFELTGAAAALRLDLAPGPELPLAGIALGIDRPALRVEAAGAPSLAAESIALRLQPTADPRVFRLTGAIAAPELPPGLAGALSRQAGLATPLPDRLDRIALEAGVELAQPPALLAPAPAALTAVDLRRADLIWGGHRIGVSGRLSITPAGWPEGTLMIALGDFPVWLDLALAAGLVPPERKTMLAAMGEYLARQSPDGSVRLPLSFAQGRMSLAAIPLGPAPRLAQRQ